MSARHTPPHGYILTAELARARGVKAKTITREVRRSGRYLGFTPIALGARCYAWPAEILQVPRRASATMPPGHVSTVDLAQGLGVSRDTPLNSLRVTGSYHGHKPARLEDGSYAWPKAAKEVMPPGYLSTAEAAKALGVSPITLSSGYHLMGSYRGVVPLKLPNGRYAWPVELLSAPKRKGNTGEMPPGFVTSGAVAKALGVAPSSPPTCFRQNGHYRGFVPIRTKEGYLAWPEAILTDREETALQAGSVA